MSHVHWFKSFCLPSTRHLSKSILKYSVSFQIHQPGEEMCFIKPAAFILNVTLIYCHQLAAIYKYHNKPSLNFNEFTSPLGQIIFEHSRRTVFHSSLRFPSDKRFCTQNHIHIHLYNSKHQGSIRGGKKFRSLNFSPLCRRRQSQARAAAAQK